MRYQFYWIKMLEKINIRTIEDMERKKFQVFENNNERLVRLIDEGLNPDSIQEMDYSHVAKRPRIDYDYDYDYETLEKLLFSSEGGSEEYHENRHEDILNNSEEILNNDYETLEELFFSSEGGSEGYHENRHEHILNNNEDILNNDYETLEELLFPSEGGSEGYHENRDEHILNNNEDILNNDYETSEELLFPSEGGSEGYHENRHEHILNKDILNNDYDNYMMSFSNILQPNIFKSLQ